jgi:hypothetical protein
VLTSVQAAKKPQCTRKERSTTMPNENEATGARREGNGKETKVWDAATSRIRRYLLVVHDSISRARDGMDRDDEGTIDWKYVRSQFARAQAEITKIEGIAFAEAAKKLRSDT